jgi:hypothetical protein
MIALPLLLSLAAAPAGTVVLDVDQAVVAAARRLGPDLELFTRKSRPLRSLDEIAAPGEEMGTGDLGLARPLLPALKAGGVKLSGGALDLMRLVSPSHFSTLFSEHPRLRLFALRRRADGAEAAIVERGGGVPVLLRARDQPELTAGIAAPPATAAGAKEPPGAAARPAPSVFVTSFGPLAGATVSPTARVRRFDPQDGPQEELRKAGDGKAFVVLTIDRDFGAGQGVVGFLFGMGTMLKAEFDGLELRDRAGARYRLTATHAEGRKVELGYEVPASVRDLVLVDGDRRQPLASLLTAHSDHR